MIELTAPLDFPLAGCRVLMIDGPDGTGKTTYAKYVAHTFGAVYMHRSRPEPGTHWMAEHLDPVLDVLESGRKVVMDRGPVGNPIWTRLFDDPESALFADEPSYQWCMSTFCFLGARVELMFRSPEAIAQELTSRGEPDHMVQAAVASVDEFYKAYETINKAIPVRLLSSDLVHQSIHNNTQGDIR